MRIKLIFQLYAIATTITITKKDPLCPNGYFWSTFNLDSPEGDGDLELYGLFSSRYGCREPLVTVIETTSDRTPYNETGQVLHVDDCFGFMCLNRENEEPCLDYQIRRCCPIGIYAPESISADIFFNKKR